MDIPRTSHPHESLVNPRPRPVGPGLSCLTMIVNMCFTTVWMIEAKLLSPSTLPSVLSLFFCIRRPRPANLGNWKGGPNNTNSHQKRIEWENTEKIWLALHCWCLQGSCAHAFWCSPQLLMACCPAGRWWAPWRPASPTSGRGAPCQTHAARAWGV